MNFIITEINENIDIDDFSCENKDVVWFLKNKCISNNREFLSKTFILLDLDTHSTMGYITLSAYLIELPSKEKYQIDHVPAILIGRFGIDKKYQEKNHGVKLIQYAIGICNEVKKFIGCRLLVAEVSKGAKIKDYLLKKGFFEEYSDEKYHYLSIDLLIGNHSN